MRSSLSARLEALERARPSDMPSAYVRCMSQEQDPEDLKRLREQEARDAYHAAHPEGRGRLGVIHRIIVRPEGGNGDAHA